MSRLLSWRPLCLFLMAFSATRDAAAQPSGHSPSHALSPSASDVIRRAAALHDPAQGELIMGQGSCSARHRNVPPFWIIAVLGLLALCAPQRASIFAQNPSSPPPAGISAEDLEKKIEEARKKLTRKVRTPLAFGISLRDLRTGKASLLAGEVVYQKHADKVFSLASNMKLFTTAAALEVIGPETKTGRSKVKDLVRKANKKSDNSLAHRLFDALGPAHFGREGKKRWHDVKALREFSRKAGLQGDFTVMDGSGVTWADRFSPNQVTRLLAYMRTRPTFQIYRSSLPSAGSDGTLGARFRNHPDRALIRAKTGHTGVAQTLSGYLGSDFAFSVLVNGGQNEGRGGVLIPDRAVRAVDEFIDTVVKLLVEHRRYRLSQPIARQGASSAGWGVLEALERAAEATSPPGGR